MDLCLQEKITSVDELLAYGHDNDRRIALFVMRNRAKLPGMIKTVWDAQVAKAKVPQQASGAAPQCGWIKSGQAQSETGGIPARCRCAYSAWVTIGQARRKTGACTRTLPRCIFWMGDRWPSTA